MVKAPTKTAAKKPAASKAIAVAEKKGTAVASSNASMFQRHAGAGLENVTAKDILIPRISILQALSPQVVKSRTEYNPEAKVGDIYDIGLGEVLGEEIMFLPILFTKSWLEWFPRNTQKGLARIHPDDSILAQTRPDDKNRPILPNGNYIAETAQFYGLNMSAGNRLSFIPMTSTQLKKSRAWLTKATGEKLVGEDGTEFTPPLFYRAYTLSVVPEQNAEGDWFGWKIESGPKLEDLEGWEKTYQMLLEQHAQISSGTARGDLAGMADETGGGGGGASNDQNGRM